MQKLNITIPKPCHKNWDKMLPDEKGKFCQSCAKIVFDFTKSSPEEITTVFKNNKTEKICGRFRTNQLENLKIEIPETVLYNQTSFRKIFLLALFIVMGTTLFSCKTDNNNYQTLGEVVIVEDTIHLKNDTIQQINEQKKDSIKHKKCNFSNKDNHINELDAIEPPTITGDFTMGIPALPDYETLLKKNKSYYDLNEVSKKPIFQKNDTDFSHFIQNNITLPDSLNNNEVVLSSFIVDTLGLIKDIIILRGKNSDLNNEIINVLKRSPKWNPGEINNKKVNVKMYYPIRIKLQ
ncbi:hypothetical protein GOQ30_07240 [Flavobacterium sp. TP390]|uniref:TonB C-terminal domain-containing protein n=1 Tax=Flavobacterium profundi TaxID=1774945 RepID=A0A6I4IH64_9FLAO|nr:hypothetical protein [Flavobacterium profundi]MVO08958.1 hypothetical protein [Flavobacterium profundi]